MDSSDSSDGPTCAVATIHSVDAALRQDGSSPTAEFLRAVIHRIVAIPDCICVAVCEAASGGSSTYRFYSSRPVATSHWRDAIAEAAASAGVEADLGSLAFSDERWDPARWRQPE